MLNVFSIRIVQSVRICVRFRSACVMVYVCIVRKFAVEQFLHTRLLFNVNFAFMFSFV